MRDEELDLALDAGLDGLFPVPEMTQAAFLSGRERLFAAMNTTTSEEDLTLTQDTPAVGAAGVAAPRPKRGRWLAAAAAVGVITAGTLVAQSFSGGGVEAEAHASAVAALNKAADLAAVTKDVPLKPGQYRYVSQRADGITSYGNGIASVGGVVAHQIWIPADPRREWMERRTETGKPQWLPGMEGRGEPIATPAALLGEWRAACGNFGYLAAGSKRSCDEGSWSNPTPQFLDSLPKDPAKLYESLAKLGDARVVAELSSVLSSGRASAEIRALFYRTLAITPSVVTTADVANLEGRQGTAIGVRDGTEFTEIIINPADGEFIGKRSVTAEDSNGIQRGAVREYTAVKLAVADGVGITPAG